MNDLTGRTLGAYKITGRAGQGGMAHVYRAIQPSIGREVAIKVLPAHYLQDETFVKRFKREVQVIAKLQHPHILPVYDFGEEDNMPYIVMAYMTGGTLADLLQREGALQLPEVVRLVDQIASGLDHAHQKGIIHRDFKPSNVLLDENKNVYLADFGIAKVTESSSQITGSGIVGTPAYMAPETMLTTQVTPLVDVYALGVTLFEMMAGQHPYPAETPGGALLAHASKPIPELVLFHPGLPSGIQTVLDRAMAKEPEMRYQTAGAIAADLRSLESGDSPLTESLPRTPTPASALAPAAIAPAAGLSIADTPDTISLFPAKAEKTGLPRRALAIIGGAVAVVAVAAGLVAFGGLGSMFGGAAAGGGPTVLTGHSDAVNGLAFTGDGKTLASGSADRTVILWDAATHQKRSTIELPDEVYSMTMYPDGKTLVVGGQSGSLTLWAVSSGDQVFKQEFLPAGQVSVAVAGDESAYAVASRDTNVGLFDGKTYAWQKALDTSGPVWSVAFSPDGKLLAAGDGSGAITLKDPVAETVVRTLTGPSGGVKYLAFAPKDNRLASASSSGGILLWDTARTQPQHTLAAQGTTSGIAWSPDGKQLASVSKEGAVTLWDTTSGAQIKTLDGGVGELDSVAFGPDGATLTAGAKNGSVLVWKLE